MKPIALILLLACVPVPAFSQPVPALIDVETPKPKPLTNAIYLVWQHPHGDTGEYQVWCGQESGAYTTNWTSSLTNRSVPISWLYVGTNYMAVTASSRDTNDVLSVSDFSEEKIVIRTQSFPLWISTEIESSKSIEATTNKEEASWSAPVKVFIGRVAPSGQMGFFRGGKLKIEALEEGTLLVHNQHVREP